MSRKKRETEIETPAQIIARVLSETVRVIRDGEAHEMTAWDAICAVIAQDAAHGDPTATRIAMRLARRWNWFQLPAGAAKYGVIILDDEDDE